MSFFAVMGSPIAHSLSPQIHEAFGRLVAIPVTYERRLVEPGTLGQALSAFARQGGVGANITVPLKVEAFDLAQMRTKRAIRAGAVNTLAWRSAGLWGDNTDGAGLVRDLTHNCAVDLQGLRVLLLGAGGAAQGIVGPLLDAGVESLVIVNRTLSRAEQLVASLHDTRARSRWDMSESFDLVINATAAGLQDALPVVPAALFSGAWVYDLVYGRRAQAFLSHARNAGARRVWDGLGMLVEQAAESFYVWHGVRPPTAAVIAEFRSLSG